jgi:serine/threonine protein kinase
MANFDFEWTNFPPNMDKQAINFFVKTTARLPENRISTRQSLEHPWITDNPEIEPPKTMDDWIKEIEKLKNCEQNFKAILVLMKIVAISNKEVKGEKQ